MMRQLLNDGWMKSKVDIVDHQFWVLWLLKESDLWKMINSRTCGRKLFSVPFLVNFACFAFRTPSDALFVCFSQLFDRLCVSVHPWGHGEGGCGVVDSPKQLSTLAQPKQLPQPLLPHQPGHLIPSIAHWAAEDVAPRSRQVVLLDFNRCLNATYTLLTKFKKCNVGLT